MKKLNKGESLDLLNTPTDKWAKHNQTVALRVLTGFVLVGWVLVTLWVFGVWP